MTTNIRNTTDLMLAFYGHLIYTGPTLRDPKTCAHAAQRLQGTRWFCKDCGKEIK